jgi:hypothetical protein
MIEDPPKVEMLAEVAQPKHHRGLGHQLSQMPKTRWTEGGSEEIRTKKGKSAEAGQSKCQRHLGQPFRGSKTR